jgi:hypothetical protein
VSPNLDHFRVEEDLRSSRLKGGENVIKGRSGAQALVLLDDVCDLCASIVSELTELLWSRGLRYRAIGCVDTVIYRQRPCSDSGVIDKLQAKDRLQRRSRLKSAQAPEREALLMSLKNKSP